MQIKEIELTPPSKEAMKFFKKFIYEHDKGLKAIKTLEEIREVLEFYANSKIGEKQEDGSYKLEFTFSDIATPFCIKYDPNPAREALQKINEVIDEPSL